MTFKDGWWNFMNYILPGSKYWMKPIYDSADQGISRLWKGLSGETSAQATLEANERNIANQNYWNERNIQLQNTAHQREVADLQAAGLNPWLSASGTGSPTGLMQSTQIEPVDGSKILTATSAMALAAIVKLLLKK